MNNLSVGPGTRITLHFSISLEDGTEVDSNYGGKPASFDYGDGNLLPGFEKAISGLRQGESAVIDIPPENGFGPHNPVNVQTLKRSDFPVEMALEEGVVISFDDAGSGELPGVVVACDEQEVTVDFNHPLAGRTISFAVQILQVDPVVTH